MIVKEKIKLSTGKWIWVDIDTEFYLLYDQHLNSEYYNEIGKELYIKKLENTGKFIKRIEESERRKEALRKLL